MPKKIDWETIKRAYLASGESYAAIADRFGVSLRSVEQHAADDGWHTSRTGLGEKPKVNKTRPTPRDRGPIDQIEVIESAIADLSADLVDSPIRSKESAATALVRLLEYREKLLPTTPAELAERAIALGISPDAFLEELRKAWSLQN